MTAHRNFYRFTSPLLTVAGHDALEELPGLLRSLDMLHPLILTDPGVRRAGLMDMVSAILKSQEDIIGDTWFDQIPPDSDTDIIAQAAQVYREKGCTGLLAVGGGSVIDTTKGVRILVSLGGEHLRDYQGADTISSQLVPMAAVPTTSGTGSEATLVAVIKDARNKRKLAFTSPSLIPSAAILDSRMTLTLPPAITAATGMDALAHAVEAYTGLGRNPISDSYALKAIELIVSTLPEVIEHPDNQEARLQMAVASHLAGSAFSNSMVGIVHTLGHCVGARCGIPHGICMSILLPYGMTYNLHRCRERFGKLLQVLSGKSVYLETSEDKRPEGAVAAVKALASRLHMLTDGAHPLRLRDILDRSGHPIMKPQHIPVIASDALGDPSHLYNPEEVSLDELISVLRAAYWGYPLDKDLVKLGHQK